MAEVSACGSPRPLPREVLAPLSRRYRNIAKAIMEDGLRRRPATPAIELRR